jgi:hypothetical protein
LSAGVYFAFAKLLLMKYFMLERLTNGFSQFLLHLLQRSIPALAPEPNRLQPILP